MIHFLKSNRFLLSYFVCLYSLETLGIDNPSVAQDSAGANLIRQLIKSLGSCIRHGQGAGRKKVFDALGNSFPRLLGAATIEDQEKR